MILIAHNIRSLHNVGAILRNAAAFGVEKVYLTGITALPPRKEIAKVSLGAEDLVPWEGGGIEGVIQRVQGEGYRVWGLDNAIDSEDIHSLSVIDDRRPLALVLGNEVEGIDAQTRAMLLGCVHIPMAQKRSLNVSVACGIALYAIKTMHL
jgi:tRNA G18 (ribose-2'-O)-methylase SpoU